jgi:predicted amidohydrolase YtcJ
MEAPNRRGDVADVILINGRIATLDERRSSASALAIVGNHQFAAVGDERSVAALRGPAMRVIDGGGRTVIPGLNDSDRHMRGIWAPGRTSQHLTSHSPVAPTRASRCMIRRERAPLWSRIGCDCFAL